VANYTLDDIREAAERKFGSTDITVNGEVVKLVNPIRLPKDKRSALLAKQAELDVPEAEAAELDQDAILTDCIRLVCESDHQANVLLAALGDDLAMKVALFEKYTGEQEAGEA
jgi:hypothetical protein